MPIYGYRCSTCGHEFEVLQKMSDTPHKACPKCGGKLAKMVYPAGMIFTGTGYYTTDYKSAGSASRNGSAESSEGAAESKPDSKSKPKSEAKSDSSTEKKTS